MPISPASKDKVLNYLVAKWPLEEMIYQDTKNILVETGVDFATLKAILNQFERLGFLYQLGVGREHTCMILIIEAHDFAHKGGFILQEEVFKANIEKLGFEIDTLKEKLGPEHLETLNKISGTTNTLLAGVALWLKS